MGISASKRIKRSLSDSVEFDSACDSAFAHCLDLTQHAFPHVFPYQLSSASDHLYQTLTRSPTRRLVLIWLKSPPNRSQIDSALRAVTRLRPEDDQTLDYGRFKEWAVELFAGAVISGVGKEAVREVPITITGIVGIGAMTRQGKGLVGTAVGVYALIVSAAIYWSFGANEMVIR